MEETIEIWRWGSIYYGDKRCIYDLKKVVSPFDVDDYFENITNKTIVYIQTRVMISEEEFKKLRVQKFVFNNDTNYVDIDDFVKGVKDFKRDKRNKIIFLEKADMAQVFWDYLTKKLKLEHVYRGQI